MQENLLQKCPAPVNRNNDTVRITQEKMLDLDKSVLPHPPYSSDLTPGDFHLFPSLQNSLNDKIFSKED